VEIGGLQKNWKEHVQPQTHRTTSHPDSGDDELNNQLAPQHQLQAIQKKQKTTDKEGVLGQSNHQEGTKTVPSHTNLML